ncbi:MAG: selenocysteine-specific translation elongation factor [Gammaproteobacteria bacterium]|nr:selenocysteine-specific translation elongation factor [Gammaproteobacteria bacterium]
MTIDIGFAWMNLSNNETIGFIDVPGHEDLMKNVMAGLWGINASLLVIAADDGWMTQTSEHLRILDYFNISHALVALTKIDTVTDPDWLNLVEDDIRARLEKTALRGSRIMRVSALTGANIGELRQAIEDLTRKAGQQKDIGKPRVYIDRVFTITGSGTVITGTLVDGSLALDQKISIFPKNLNGRIRGIESYKKMVDRGLPGSRVALNLAGIKKEDLERGDIIFDKEEMAVASRWVDVKLNLDEANNWVLKDKINLLAYMGTRELPVVVKLLDKKSLNPGTTDFVQLQFETPVSCRIGDRLILRRPSPALTVGGATVLDPLADKFRVRNKDRLLSRLENRVDLELNKLIITELQKRNYVLRDELLLASHFAKQEIEHAVRNLKELKALIIASQWLVNASLLDEKKQEMVELLRQYHRDYPMVYGITQAELMTQLDLPKEILDSIIKLMVAGKLIKMHETYVSLPDHTPTVTTDQEFIIARILQLFEEYTKAPPKGKELAELVAGSENVIPYMCRNNLLVSLPEDVLLEARQYESLKSRIIDIIRKQGSISIQTARDQFGYTRKYIIPLFTKLDSEGITTMKNNERVFTRAYQDKLQH